MVNGHTLTYPRSKCISPVTEPRYTYLQVLLSGVVASLLLRPGRMLNVPSENTGPDSLSLGCAPLPNGGLRYVGLMSEIPASYAASASLGAGSYSELQSDFQVTRSKRKLPRNENLRFDAPCVSCLSGSTFQRRAERGSAGELPAWPFSLWEQRSTFKWATTPNWESKRSGISIKPDDFDLLMAR